MGGVIAFVAGHNHEGKRDSTGAFQPEARRFLAMHGGEPEEMFLIDNRRPMKARAKQVLGILDRYRGRRTKLSCVAFFCHGYRTGIQAGFRSGKRANNVDDLAEAIVAVSGPGVIVPLYCCSTAGSTKTAPGGDGGFADELRDRMVDHGARNVRIDAHTTLGHTTRNPYVRRFEGPKGAYNGGVGGTFIVEPASKMWGTWKRALRAQRSELRLAFPFYSVPYIHGELARLAAPSDVR